MRSLRIRGGVPLSGEIRISGAKNAALPVLAATVCFGDVCRIENCPDLSDVDAAVQILTHLGAKCHRFGRTITVDPRPICRWDIPPELMGKMRGSLFFMGPLMARFGRCSLPSPGGCPLGERPVDFHLTGLAALGAGVSRTQGLCCAGSMVGADVVLPYPSVGATENLVMAALGARGCSRIMNAAREPEIVQLCDFLRSGGGQICGDGTDTIRVQGGLPQGGKVRLIPDRMETATYLCAAAAGKGSIRLTNTEPRHCQSVIEVLRRAGCSIACRGNAIEIHGGELVSPGTITTGPYPAFPTDAQAPVMAALLRAKGRTTIRESVFSHRMGHIPALQCMGGRIVCHGDTAVIVGTEALHGAAVAATDLRAGAALVIAGLAAEGETKITGTEHLLRGYEDIAGKLSAVGARIWFG